MILVVRKIFKLLSLLRYDREISLAELSVRTGQNKGTLCNLLKSLIELEIVMRKGNGSYLLTGKLRNFGMEHDWLTAAAENAVLELADNTRESGVAAMLESNRLRILAQRRFERELMVGVSCYANLSLFHSVSGRIILAGLEPDQLELLLSQTGLPEKEWLEASSRKKLDSELLRLRESGIAVMENPAAGIKAFAVPFRNGNGTTHGSLGLTVPSFRLSGGNEHHIISALKRAGVRLSRQLQNPDGESDKWKSTT